MWLLASDIATTPILRTAAAAFGLTKNLLANMQNIKSKRIAALPNSRV